MKTTIYINQDVIQIAQHSGKKMSCTSIELALGTILNGVIINEQEVLDKLNGLDKKLRSQKMSLVVDSSNIMIKKLVTPPLAAKHLPSVLKGEFEVADENNYLYDFSLLESNKQGNVLFASAAQRELILTYIKLFQKAKIKLVSIDIAINSVIKHIYQSKQLKEKSFILNVAAKNMLLTFLFENGKYQLANRNRLVNEPGSQTYVTELYSRLSSILQFSQAQRSEHPIKASYYVGVDADSVSALSTYMGESDVEIAPFSDEGIDSSCFFACCGLQSLKEDINLTQRYKEATSKPIQIPAIFFQGLFLAALAGGMAYLYIDWSMKNIALESQIIPLESYITSSSTAETLEELNLLKQEQALLDQQIAEYEQVSAQLQSGRTFSSDLLTTVYSTQPIESLQYTLSDRSIYISGLSEEIGLSSDYAEGLRNSGYFSPLHYTGYTAEQAEKAQEDGSTMMSATYNFNIQAWLVEEEVSP